MSISGCEEIHILRLCGTFTVMGDSTAGGQEEFVLKRVLLSCFGWTRSKKKKTLKKEKKEQKSSQEGGGEWGFGLSGELQTSLSDSDFPFSQFFLQQPSSPFSKTAWTYGLSEANALVLPFLQDANTLKCQSGCHARQVSPLQISSSMKLPVCECFNTNTVCAAPKSLNAYLTFPLRRLCSLSASVVMPTLLF